MDAQLGEARGGAKREGFRVMPAAHIAQPKVPKPPRRSDGAGNRTCAFWCVSGNGLFAQRMKHARGCVSDTLPLGLEPNQSFARTAVGGCWMPFTCKQRWRCVVCRQRALDVVGHSHADSKRPAVDPGGSQEGFVERVPRGGGVEGLDGGWPGLAARRARGFAPK